jgi:hypothetical protein
VLPAYLRRTKNVEELLPWLYASWPCHAAGCGISLPHTSMQG